MRNLQLLLTRYHFLLLFLLLEGACFYLIFQYNHFQRTSILSSANALSGNLFGVQDGALDYFRLGKTNQKLAAQNADLLNELNKMKYRDFLFNKKNKADTTSYQNYEYSNAEVINLSTNRLYNFLTINRGTRDGIKEDMGVIGSQGVVGVVRNVSTNFATVISLLHKNFKLSSKIKRNGYYGSLNWNGKQAEIAQLLDIPLHANIEAGDTVVTSGYSSLFPEGILVGVIENIAKQDGGHFYDLDVRLSTDFKNLDQVFIVDYKLREEKVQLESKITDE